MQRFDIVNKQWLTPRDSDDVAVGGGGRFISIQRHMQEHLTKLYFVKEPNGNVFEVHYDDVNDGDITVEDLGVTSPLWGFQILVPVYFNELLA